MMPADKHLFVSAKGAGYIIDVKTHTLVKQVGTHVAFVLPVRYACQNPGQVKSLERRLRGRHVSTTRRRIAFCRDAQPKELNVRGVAGTYGLLCLDEELFTADGDRHAVDGHDLDPSFGRACVVNTAGGLEQIDDDLVRDSDNLIREAAGRRTALGRPL
jgi:hypothetical protein